MRPVFYDPSGRRRRMTRRTVFGLLLTLLVAAVIFATTVVNVPAPSPLSIGYERMTALPFRAQISRITHRIVDLRHRPAPIVQTRTGARPLTIAFYSAEADNSVNTLLRNINEIDWVAPTLLTLDPAGQLAATDDPTLRRVVGNSLHRPAIVPVIQNIQNEQWEGAGAARLMARGGERPLRVRSCAQLSDAVIATTDPNLFRGPQYAAWERVRSWRARSWVSLSSSKVTAVGSYALPKA